MTGLRLGMATLLIVTALSPATASAEPLLFHVELSGALPVTAPQKELFGPGASVALGVEYPLLPQLLVGARLRLMGLLEGSAPADSGREDPGIGTLESAALAVRLRPFGGATSLRSTGLFVDGAFGAGLTGTESRTVFEAGIGYGIDLGDLVFAPVARYLQVIQGKSPISEDDARIAMLGFSLTGGEERAVPPPPPPPTPPPPPADRDADGVSDVADACPDDPEDHDGHEDADGCPEADNDGDGILDVDDRCPDEAEDMDEFEDEDGCPEPDNDRDGFLDDDDECPNDPETVNGNRDYDGCPDEGLIEFKNDRIVLEECVLFDLERARVKRAGQPTLTAIVALQRQHPEWIAIDIQGHADVRGAEDYNDSLSERRANNVRAALVKLGIPGELITSHGFGARRPRDKRDVEEAHARNRRVEFVVQARTGPAAPAEPDNGPEPAAEPGPAGSAESSPAGDASPDGAALNEAVDSVEPGESVDGAVDGPGVEPANTTGEAEVAP